MLLLPVGAARPVSVLVSTPRETSFDLNTLSIRLTMGIYTHIGLHDQTRAIESLPGPPNAKDTDRSDEAGSSEAV